MGGNEIDTLVGSLERQRATLWWKCAGLGAEGLQTRLGVSAMTLGGLLKHLARVEDLYFSQRVWGEREAQRWNGVPWDADWTSAAHDTPKELYALWQEMVARSRRILREVLADGGLEQSGRFVFPDGRAPSVRRILIDLIEEYARHVGHADLLRESVDGLVGEDPAEWPLP